MHPLSLIISAFMTVATTAAPITPGSFSSLPYFILAGDSTTATQSSNGGGWGDGFLNTTLFNGASGVNKGHNGATTISFRQQGFWQGVLSEIQQVQEKKQQYIPYVTIQFGHNDQKIKSLTLDQYQSNLETFAQEVKYAGGIPILVTPLSRRNYEKDNSNDDGREVIKEDLAEQREATIRAAIASQTVYIDLNAASEKYLNAIGPEKAWTYNLIATNDHTHLNDHGSQVFGGLVAELMLENPSLAAPLGVRGYVRVDEELKRALRDGKYFWPSS
ncbi:esterase [Ascosphaera apis ARSEF 7405]|uniref:Esterase n=1 Tax=Ascosphaera apis ARSEF 7405 TaxID=392613 RepID=A0A168DUN2_9EURO|nr:esterase [Ascosphaera apis ARSEF 7405]